MLTDGRRNAGYVPVGHFPARATTLEHARGWNPDRVEAVTRRPAASAGHPGHFALTFWHGLGIDDACPGCGILICQACFDASVQASSLRHVTEDD